MTPFACEITDPIDSATLKPVYTGPKGRAWMCDTQALLAALGVTPKQSAVLQHWVIERPDAHPLWHSYSIMLVHLRSIPGMPEAEKMLVGATHEFWLHALRPEAPRAKIIAGTEKIMPHTYSPMNFGAQLRVADDAAACKRIEEQAVMKIVAGALNPDTDARTHWISIFGGALLRRRT